MLRLPTLASLALAAPLMIFGQTAGTPAEIVVSVGHYYGKTVPALTADDVIVTEGLDPLTVTGMVPLRGDLDLFVLVDSCSNCEPGSKFEELRRFINSQPSTTKIGIAYINGGRLQVAEAPTLDRARAVKALSAPEGGKPSSPFSALKDLIDHWPGSSTRRAVVMVSNGIDPAADAVYQSPSAEAALESAQRNGVVVFAIYHPSADYLNDNFSKLYSGQVQLSHVADESGGEAYFLSFGPLPSLGPLLADLSEHLANRYLIQFLAKPEQTPGLEEVTVKTKIPDLDLMAPQKVWVGGNTKDVSKDKRP